MNTQEMIVAIRQQLLEFDENPINDTSILANMNLAYMAIYSHITRADDSRFGQKITLSLTANVTEYDLPREAWGKRISQLVVPFPPTGQDNALGYHKVKRVTFTETYKHNVPRIKVWVPEVFSVLNNKIYVYPKPITGMDAYLVIAPQLVPLGQTIGSILSVAAAPDIELGEMNTTKLEDNLADDTRKAILSVSDYISGRVKQLYTYSTVDATNKLITIANVANRTTYQGTPITQIAGADLYPITTANYDADNIIVQDDYVTAGYSTAVSMFGTEYDEFLINMTVLKIRSSLNENDPEILNAMKESMSQLKSDTAGRPTGVHMQRDFGRGASYTRPGRIS